jgi:hypothetical protein
MTQRSTQNGCSTAYEESPSQLGPFHDEQRRVELQARTRSATSLPGGVACCFRLQPACQLQRQVMHVRSQASHPDLSHSCAARLIPCPFHRASRVGPVFSAVTEPALRAAPPSPGSVARRPTHGSRSSKPATRSAPVPPAPRPMTTPGCDPLETSPHVRGGTTSPRILGFAPLPRCLTWSCIT